MYIYASIYIYIYKYIYEFDGVKVGPFHVYLYTFYNVHILLQ